MFIASAPGIIKTKNKNLQFSFPSIFNVPWWIMIYIFVDNLILEIAQISVCESIKEV